MSAFAMLSLFAWLAAVEGPSAESSGILVESEVSSQLYTWTVKNHDAPPLVGFEVPAPGTYSHETPDGWTFEVVDDRFIARPEQAHDAIYPGEQGVFTARVTSTGAVLSQETVRVRPLEDSPIELASVWAPAEKPRAAVVMVVVTLLVLVGVHVAWVSRRGRAGQGDVFG